MRNQQTHKKICLKRLFWCVGVIFTALFVMACQQNDTGNVQTSHTTETQDTTTTTTTLAIQYPTITVTTTTVSEVEGSTDGSNAEEPLLSPEDDGFVDDVDNGGGVDVRNMAPGLGDRSGALRLVPPPLPYVGLDNEIYDLCDDADAFLVLFARRLEPGEQISEDERDEITRDRIIDEVSCDEPGGRRYVYMGDHGPGGVFRTVQGAIDDHNERYKYVAQDRITIPPDRVLGSLGALNNGFMTWKYPLEDIDEIKVDEGSVSVRDNVIRGLVRNFSKVLFGREVTVTANPMVGKETVNNSALPASGRFPLTVQPGERVPFEIRNWAGSSNPNDFTLTVTAKMSTNIDLTRAIAFGRSGPHTGLEVTGETLKEHYPDFVYQHEKHKIPADGRIDIQTVEGGLMEPTSHPSLKGKTLDHTIEDLRVYLATFNYDGTVHDITEPPLYVSPWFVSHPHDYPQIVSIPTTYQNRSFKVFSLTFIPNRAWHLYAGEPGPLDHNPRTPPTQQPTR